MLEAVRTTLMAIKEKKTINELKQLVMQQIRKHPYLHDILNVGITRPMQAAPHHPNWNATFGMGDRRPTPAREVQIVTELQNKYDCSWSK
jgi:hypothetical protein